MKPHRRLLTHCTGLLLLINSGLAWSQAPAAACPTELKSQRSLFGPTLDLCSQIAAAKAVLVVNTASKCGYTRQFKGLQELHERYAEQGLLVIGIPTADFGGQEYNNDKQTAKFCRVNYGVSFTMLPRSCVDCADPQPLFAWLHAQGGQVASWNFHKLIYDPASGKVLNFPSAVPPTSPAVQAALVGLLGSSSPE